MGIAAVVVVSAVLLVLIRVVVLVAPVSCVSVVPVIVACVFVSVVAVVILRVWSVVFADDDGFVVAVRMVVDAFLVGLGVGLVRVFKAIVVRCEVGVG